MATDPVCRMQVEEDKAAATVEHGGKQYYFCCQACKDKFAKDPERCVKAMESSA